MADFLVCVFGPELSDAQRGVVHRARDGRNATTYGDPSMPNVRLVGEAWNVARRLADLAAAL